MKIRGSFQLTMGADMSGSVTTQSLDVHFVDNVAVQWNFTGTPTGSFFVDGSLDNLNWVPFTLTPAPTASGSAGSVLVNMSNLAVPYVRFRYVPGSGAGALDTFVEIKSLGS